MPDLSALLIIQAAVTTVIYRDGIYRIYVVRHDHNRKQEVSCPSLLNGVHCIGDYHTALRRD